uniref:DUF4079 domain-containing protein n=1 Tax=Chaetoceros debilis TaxID=122233 RepID=A0A7S3QGW5_9STRA|eukprot:CAMPEP_0194085964 /NCGR_PEP_ID=MMETSP0149-20130528/19433_1 /TAXON_ID=122233 /ORGANISM="Chaetoceros debilis, Strain MM31A-1" /LENGTH=293 /DNA_ID=CAMNT_0038768955 /DNA_START=27 /DNA_END=908 /DNA_ORIENTATION=+
MKVINTCILATAATTASAFSSINAFTGVRSSSTVLSMKNTEEVGSFDPLNLSSESSTTDFDAKPALVSLLAMGAFAPMSANAAGPDWGIFEGRTGSLLHPVIMGGTFMLSVSAALKGFQYRRQRTMGGEISALKKTLPAFRGSSLTAAITAAETAEEVDNALISKLKAAMPIQIQIDELNAERKELSSKNLRDNHFAQGSLLAFIGTAFAIEGPLNTYARAGKLFPGPHLYAGAGLVVLWAAAAACVPAMQKGNDTARSLHIAFNVSGMGLFAWQITTGIPILQKVVQFTKWP